MSYLLSNIFPAQHSSLHSFDRHKQTFVEGHIKHRWTMSLKTCIANFATTFCANLKCYKEIATNFKPLQNLKCHIFQKCRMCPLIATSVLLFPSAFPLFISVFFLNIWSPSFFPTFPHSCAGQPGFSYTKVSHVLPSRSHLANDEELSDEVGSSKADDGRMEGETGPRETTLSL